MPDEKGKPKTPSFVDDIVKDPKEPPQTVLLQGYSGAAVDDANTRLYLDPALSSYVDIPKDAVLHSEDVPQGRSVLGGVYLWVKKGAGLKYGPSVSQQASEFLKGSIQQEFAGGGAAGQAGLPASQLQPCPLTVGPPCEVTLLPTCPTHLPPCTQLAPCPTHQPPCTLTPPCPTHQPPCTQLPP
ncbi:MAG TPA: hypothetical protein VG096_05860, partial [Bryobacteraceae bacterium]|nr:hypothetical protein [Bryobacteraceae bacterium]